MKTNTSVQIQTHPLPYPSGRLLLLLVAMLCVATPKGITAQDASDFDAPIRIPTRILNVRAYGGNDERLPPVYILRTEDSGSHNSFGESSVTIEIDAQAEVTPSLYVVFYHCDAQWQEDNNVFINDQTLRTSNIDWEQAPIHSHYFNYRGFLNIPNLQVEFAYSGNWKAKIYDFDRLDQDSAMAEVRFFVVEPIARCEVLLSSDFYDPVAKGVSPIAINLEAEVYTPSNLFDNRLNTVVFYRNHRWFEPLTVSQDLSVSSVDQLYNSKTPTSVFGMSGVVKRFRIGRVPAQNAYRILDLTRLVEFPITREPQRPLLADLRRNGTYFYNDNDGALLTRNVVAGYDDYVNVEFVLDPEGSPSRLDVFLAGSFNNWKISPEWQMYYDKEERLYKLRQWVRRSEHNYLYATGKLNVDSRDVDALNFEEFEGNTLSAGHTFLAFVYYRQSAFGGYDALIGLGAANIFGPIRR